MKPCTGILLLSLFCIPLQCMALFSAAAPAYAETIEHTGNLPELSDSPTTMTEEGKDDKKLIYESGMDPAIYQQALEKTGMAASLSTRDAAPVSAADSGTSWVRKGPVGDFSFRNGRVAGVNIIATGSGTYRVYAGASSGGLWVTDSQNLGAWTSMGDTIPNPAVRAFAIDPNVTSRIFVGTGDPGRWKGSGMYVTYNEGGSWYAVTLPVVPQQFYRLFFIPYSAGRLIAASSSGILLSDDTGQTWTMVLTGDVTDLALDPSVSTSLYAVRRNDGVYRSQDSGNSWEKIYDADFPSSDNWQRASLAISPSNHNVAYMVLEKDGAIYRVFRTSNAWEALPDWIDVTGNLAGNGSQGGHSLSIAVRPNNEYQVFVANSDIASSDTGGTSWNTGASQTGINPGHSDITNLYFSGVTGNNILWITNDGGIYRHDFTSGLTVSLNGNSLTGLAISQVNNMDADRDMRVAGLQDNGTIRSVNSGQSWDFIRGGDGYNMRITDPEAHDFWFTDGVHPAPYYSNMLRLPYGGPLEQVANIKSNLPIVFNRLDDRIYSDDEQGIVSRSQSGSASAPWTAEVNQLQTDDYSIRDVTGSPVDGNTLIVSYNDPNRRDVTIVRKTGGSWTVLHRENIVDASSKGAILANPCVASPQWANEFWVLIEGPPGTPKILHTVDDGLHWNDITGNLDAVQQVRSLAVTPFNPRILYAGTDLGIFRTLDGGVTWAPFMDGLPIVPVWKLFFVVDDQHLGQHQLVAGTNGRGFYEYTVNSPPILYVDKRYQGTQHDGTFEHPYITVAGAVTAAPAGSIIALHTDNYVEPQTIGERVTLVTYGGHSVIR